MFRSKARELVYPQSEHARLAAIIAAAWGNQHFAMPKLPFASFVCGVLCHDRGYGFIDNESLPDPVEERWLSFQQKGAELDQQDLNAEILILMHLRRLVGRNPSEKRLELCQQLDLNLEKLLSLQSLPRSIFEQADRITNFCDNVAFEFCFEQPATGSVEVCFESNSDRTVELHYQIQANQQITFDPWPLNTSPLQSFLLAYHSEGYPNRLEPIVVPFTICPTN